VLSEVEVSGADLESDDDVVRVTRAARPEWVFHLAAHGAYPFQTDVQRMVRTNVGATVALARAALDAGCEAFVNTGSSSEYGLKDHAPAEAEALEPNSEYAVTKAAATLYCRYLGRATGRRVVTLRLYSVYGPFEEPSRLIPALVMLGLKGRLPPLAAPDTARDFVYVEDVVDAYLLATAAAPGSVYNVGTGIQTSLAQLVELARSALGVKAEPGWGAMESRRWDTSTWVADARLIRAELGWTPRHPLEAGFRETVRWFQDNPRLLERYLVAAVGGDPGK
jgi:dolichol-phosphate mannosyltransferase